ncbi:hypothetical protein ACQJBY_036668 [Aegilops geniculata]
MAASAAFAAVAVMMLVAAHLAVAAAAPVTAPAFLWAPENYGSHETKGVVHYQTTSPASLAKSVLDEGGWSNLVCSREGSYKNVDIAVVFLGSKISLINSVDQFQETMKFPCPPCIKLCGKIVTERVFCVEYAYSYIGADILMLFP